MSYFEIYNERIRDLLSDRTGQTSGVSSSVSDVNNELFSFFTEYAALLVLIDRLFFCS